jgi:hypothetical protein
MNNTELEKEIKKSVNILLNEKGFVCSIDMLLKLDYLTKDDYEAWRRGKIEYLEKACHVNLSKLSTINRTIRKIATDLKLEKSWTGYNKYGKGANMRLRFSKSGDENIEKAYATHYMDKRQINELRIKKDRLLKEKADKEKENNKIG